MMLRALALCSWIMAMATVALGANARPEPSDTPNFIIVFCDDQGYQDLGCFGSPDIKTPNVDRLAAEGMKFTQHYAGSTVCAPTRCSLMTGLHTGHTYVRGNREVQPEGQAAMPADIVTIPRLLREPEHMRVLEGMLASLNTDIWTARTATCPTALMRHERGYPEEMGAIAAFIDEALDLPPRAARIGRSAQRGGPVMR